VSRADRTHPAVSPTSRARPSRRSPSKICRVAAHSGSGAGRARGPGTGNSGLPRSPATTAAAAGTGTGSSSDRWARPAHTGTASRSVESGHASRSRGNVRSRSRRPPPNHTTGSPTTGRAATEYSTTTAVPPAAYRGRINNPASRTAPTNSPSSRDATAAARTVRATPARAGSGCPSRAALLCSAPVTPAEPRPSERDSMTVSPCRTSSSATAVLARA